MKIELFQKEYGYYPAALKNIRDKGIYWNWKTSFRSDIEGRSLGPEGWPFIYFRSSDGKNYELKSAGGDRQYNTSGDTSYKSSKK